MFSWPRLVFKILKIQGGIKARTFSREGLALTVSKIIIIINTYLRHRWQTLNIHKNSRNSWSSSDSLYTDASDRKKLFVFYFVDKKKYDQTRGRQKKTCKGLKISFAKNSLLFWCFGGEDYLVNNWPVLQGVRETDSFFHLKISFKRTRTHNCCTFSAQFANILDQHLMKFYSGPKYTNSHF